MQSAILLPVVAVVAVVVAGAAAAVLVVRPRRRRSSIDTVSWSVAADNIGERNRLFSLPPLVEPATSPDAAQADTHPDTHRAESAPPHAASADPRAEEPSSTLWDPPPPVSVAEGSDAAADAQQPWWFER